MKNKVYALIGPHASGKSTIALELMRFGVHYIPLYTTRLPESCVRDPMESARLFRFLPKEEFAKQDFLVKSTYKSEYYGLMKKDILDALQTHGASVVLIDPQSIKRLSTLLKENVEFICIMADYITLVERMLRMRYTNNEIKYHIEYAENNGEFDTWKYATHIVKNILTLDRAMNQILAILGLTQPAGGRPAPEPAEQPAALE